MKGTYCAVTCAVTDGASKHAMTGFCDGLRVEVQPHNIHVCNICPSYIKTGFSYSALNHDGQKLGGEKVEKQYY